MHAVDDRITLERHIGNGNRQVEAGYPAEQVAEHHIQLHPGQILAQALVYAISEGDVVSCTALDVEYTRMAERTVIPVGRCRQRDESLARADHRAGDLDVRSGHPEPG